MLWKRLGSCEGVPQLRHGVIKVVISVIVGGAGRCTHVIGVIVGGAGRCTHVIGVIVGGAGRCTRVG